MDITFFLSLLLVTLFLLLDLENLEFLDSIEAIESYLLVITDIFFTLILDLDLLVFGFYKSLF